MYKYNTIVLFGPPGVGKGTQGKLLSQDSKYFHFSSGEMFRNLDINTNLGKKVRNLIDQGNFVDDNTTLDLVQVTLKLYSERQIYKPNNQYLLLDGLPRNIHQVTHINEFLNVKQMIYFYVKDNFILFNRLRERAFHENRPDDSKESIIEGRIKKYELETLNCLNGYPTEIIYKIDASQNILEINNILKKNILK